MSIRTTSVAVKNSFHQNVYGMLLEFAPFAVLGEGFIRRTPPGTAA